MPEFKTKAIFDGVWVVHETDKAILCDIDGEKIWIPLSQIDDDSEVWRPGDKGRLVINEWLAKEKKLV